MMDIDPLETIIAWLGTALKTVDGRVAAKHRYGESWETNQTGASVHLDTGGVDLYAKVTKPRLEIRIYADDPVKVVTTWRELVGLSRDHARFTVILPTGKALVHYFHQQTGLSLLYNDALKMEMGVVFFETMISEEAVL